MATQTVTDELTDAADVPPVDVVLLRRSVPGMLADAWHSRAFVEPLGRRLLNKMYVKTRVGASWLVLRPIIETFGLTLVFGGILGAPTNGLPYLVFLLGGMLGWRLFESTANWGVRSFDRFQKMVRGLDFPLLLVPVAASAEGLLQLLVYSVFLLVTLVVYLIAEGTFYLELGLPMLLALAGFAMAWLVGISISLWLSVLNAYTRDVRQVFRFALPLWLYLTPVLYSSTQLRGQIGVLLDLNPMTAPVEMIKRGLFGIDEVSMLGLGCSLAITTVGLLGGLIFFEHHSRKIFARSQELVGVADDDDDDDDGGAV